MSSEQQQGPELIWPIIEKIALSALWYRSTVERVGCSLRARDEASASALVALPATVLGAVCAHKVLINSGHVHSSTSTGQSQLTCESELGHSSQNHLRLAVKFSRRRRRRASESAQATPTTKVASES